MAKKLATGQRGKQLNVKPDGLIDLSRGDPDFGCPQDIREAAKRAIDEGYVNYPPPMGDPELRAAIATYLSSLYKRKFEQKEVFITHGGTGAIYAAMSGYLNQGDDVLLFDPALSIFSQIAEKLGANSIYVPSTEDFHLDVEALEKSVTPRSRMIVLVNPGNPAGVVYRHDEVEAIMAFAASHDLLLLADETYEHIVYDGRPHVSVCDYPEIWDRTILVNTVSKTFAMTGFRIGFVAGRTDLIHPAALTHRAVTGTLNSIAQRAALWGFTQTVHTGWRRWLVEEFQRRRDLMVSVVKQAPGLDCWTPEGAIYLLVNVETPISAEDFEDLCLQHGVGVRSGTEFGPRAEGTVRLTLGNHPGCYEEGIRRLASAAAASRQVKLRA